jgi:hypothetical protein
MFTYEANFNLSRYVNSQNNRYWNTEDPHALIQLPFTTETQAYGVRLVQTVSLDRYFMKELLMMKYRVMKYSTIFR